MADKLEIGTTERVALDLMLHIASREEDNKDKYHKPDIRAYYLTLFHQCVKAAHGPRNMKDILDTE